MILMGYDASVFNSVQVSPHWVAYFDKPVWYHSCAFLNQTNILRGSLPHWINKYNLYRGRNCCWLDLLWSRCTSWVFSSLQVLTGLIVVVQADYLGRRYGMGIACILTTIATFVQTFAPRGNLGAFMAGRVIIGFGIGMAISKLI